MPSRKVPVVDHIAQGSDPAGFVAQPSQGLKDDQGGGCLAIRAGYADEAEGGTGAIEIEPCQQGSGFAGIGDPDGRQPGLAFLFADDKAGPSGDGIGDKLMPIGAEAFDTDKDIPSVQEAVIRVGGSVEFQIGDRG